MIFHSTFVANQIDALVKEVPELKLGLREENDTFILLVPHNFDYMPPITRAVAFHAINDMMQRLKDAGIRVSMERSFVL